MFTFRCGFRCYRLRAWHERPGGGRDVGWDAPWILRAAAFDPLFAHRAMALLAEPTTSDLVTSLLAAIRRGSLVLEEAEAQRAPLIPALARGRAAAEEDAPAPEVRELDWIEIEIVDAEGNPMPHVLVELTLPNEQTKRQMTNENGWLRVESIPSGNCSVRLPHWDRASWRPA